MTLIANSSSRPLLSPEEGTFIYVASMYVGDVALSYKSVWVRTGTALVEYRSDLREKRAMLGGVA